MRSGFLLLETLISITIFSIFILFFVASFNNISASQDETWKRVQASFYAQEALEVSYNIITNTHDWTNLVTSLARNPIYKISTQDGPSFLPGSEDIDDFHREIMVKKVFRMPATHEIVDEQVAGAIYDPDTLAVTAKVKWTGKGGDQDIDYTTYLTRGAQQ